ncbi:MAG: amidohydrolase family protein [Rhodoferax sp.]|nr:amidohydrolase family protein [Rhodoferax sp.]
MTAWLFDNGQLIDGTARAACSDALLVVDDTIAAVGEEALARARHLDRLERVDLAGRTLMPGLIDAHCHLSFDDASSNSEIFFQRRNALSALTAAYNARKLLRAGVTGILDPDSVFENMVDVRDAQESGLIQAPRIACGCYALIPGLGGTAGGLIRDEGVTGYYRVVNGRDEIMAEVRRQIKVGADWIKVHVSGVAPRYAYLGEQCSWTLDELKLICEVAHDLGVPVMGHCRGDESTRRAVLSGMDLLFHATGISADTTALIIDRRIPVCPALTFQANMIDHGAMLGTDPSIIALFEREIRDSVDNMKRLHQAGVPLLCGSESGFSMVPYGHWHYREMEVFMRYFGMSALEAISCGTQNGAIALKMQGKTGALKAGMKADLLVVNGDPLKDVTVLGQSERIAGVWLNGKSMDLSAPQARKPIRGWVVPTMGSRLENPNVRDHADGEL